jgi:hypothetical protein
VGEEVTLVGYGLVDELRELEYLTQPRQHKSGLKIAGVGPNSIEEGVTTVPPRALILKGPSGCVGDSGGPLLASQTGALLGVYSLQDGESCQAPDVRHQLVHVPPFRALIDEAFQAAGATPIPELDPSNGAGGESGAPGSGATGGSEPEPGGDDDDERSGCHFARTKTSTTLYGWLTVLGLLATVRRRRRA